MEFSSTVVKIFFCCRKLKCLSCGKNGLDYDVQKWLETFERVL